MLTSCKVFLLTAFLFVLPLPASALSEGEDPLHIAEEHFQSGDLLMIRGAWAQAVRSYRTALSLNPNYPGAHMNLGCALALEGKYDQAILELQKASQREPKPWKAFALFDVGGVYLKQALVLAQQEQGSEGANRNFEKAAQNFMLAVKILPTFVLAWDWANFSSSAAQTRPRQVILSVEGMGLAPDTGAFLGEKIYGTGNETVLRFDSETVPGLYFYQSPNALLMVSLFEIHKGNVAEAERLRDEAADILKIRPDQIFYELSRERASDLLFDIDLRRTTANQRK